VNFDQDLEHLSYVDQSENSRYDSRAVFSGVGVGVEVEEYDGFTLYEWRCDKDFEGVLNSVERFFPLKEPALGLVKEEGRLRDVESDFESKEDIKQINQLAQDFNLADDIKQDSSNLKYEWKEAKQALVELSR
jgi:hypothetical protein